MPVCHVYFFFFSSEVYGHFPILWFLLRIFLGHFYVVYSLLVIHLTNGFSRPAILNWLCLHHCSLLNVANFNTAKSMSFSFYTSWVFSPLDLFKKSVLTLTSYIHHTFFSPVFPFSLIDLIYITCILMYCVRRDLIIPQMMNSLLCIICHVVRCHALSDSVPLIYCFFFWCQMYAVLITVTLWVPFIWFPYF